MKNRTGLFVSFVAAIVIVVSGVGFVVFHQSQKAKPEVQQQTKLYEQEKISDKKQDSQSSTAQPAITEQQPIDPAPVAQEASTVQVYFSKNPDSTSADMVYAVSRSVYEGEDATNVAIRELLAGPSADEKTDGYTGGIELQGDSKCDGKDFKLTVNESTATLQLCRKYRSAGAMQDASTKAQFVKTIEEITGVEKVILLDSSGGCLFQARAGTKCATN